QIGGFAGSKAMGSILQEPGRKAKPALASFTGGLPDPCLTCVVRGDRLRDAVPVPGDRDPSPLCGRGPG
ncbi:MAG: hypothetical protein ABIN58_01810, partial [candidate division WOR-3 bacterium]